MLLDGFLFGLGIILAVTAFIAVFSGITIGVVHLWERHDKKKEKQQTPVFVNRLKEYERSNN